MKIVDLIHQHQHWKNLIESMFNKQDSSILNPSTLIKDHECDLGKWILSDDTKYFNSNDFFVQLKDLHQQFHYLSGKIAIDYQAGQIEEAKVLQIEFNEVSDKLVAQLERLMKEIEENK